MLNSAISLLLINIVPLAGTTATAEEVNVQREEYLCNYANHWVTFDSNYNFYSYEIVDNEVVRTQVDTVEAFEACMMP